MTEEKEGRAAEVSCAIQLVMLMKFESSFVDNGFFSELAHRFHSVFVNDSCVLFIVEIQKPLKNVVKTCECCHCFHVIRELHEMHSLK